VVNVLDTTTTKVVSGSSPLDSVPNINRYTMSTKLDGGRYVPVVPDHSFPQL
jgi:hypothetical protein